MILQSLAAYYDALCAQPGSGICAPGYSTAKVTAALCLLADGTLEAILPLQAPDAADSKQAARPLVLAVPQQEKRSVGIKPNFLCDAAGYLLGLDTKSDPARARQCFAAAGALHHAVLEQAQSPAARAVLAFFDTWQPDAAAENPLIQGAEKMLATGSLVFRFAGSYVQADAAVRAAWQAYRAGKTTGQDADICLVTGRRGPTARLHTNLKGIPNGQPSGVALVSFNAPAFESYDKAQGANAPVSEEGMFAYTTALNALLADREHRWQMGDTTVVFWAQSAEKEYADSFAALAADAEGFLSERDLKRLLDTICCGACCDIGEQHFDPDMPFYVLGLSSNVARASVRFFCVGNFGQMLQNIQKHRQRMELVRPAYEKRERISLWQMLNETIRKTNGPAGKNKPQVPSPEMAGEVMQAILNDTPYPESLRTGVMLRIAAEHRITWGRAAILKAFLTKKAERNESAVDLQLKEVLTMQHGVKLNPESEYLPYLLGRAFAVLEATQKAQNPDLNTTIKDHYFNAACTMPNTVFSTLMRLYGSHQKVLMRKDAKRGRELDEKLSKIIKKMHENCPARLNLDEQGAFIIGYYHENQSLYTKKEEKEDV